MESLAVEKARFNNNEMIELRVAEALDQDQGFFRTALRYLYLDDGPTNIPPDRRKVAEKYLEPAELILIRWLATRTNGSERKNYGPSALKAARSVRYRCQECDYSDVRALHLDHVDGRVNGTAFACLCANCHMIKSRAKDWTGKKRVAIIDGQIEVFKTTSSESPSSE